MLFKVESVVGWAIAMVFLFFCAGRKSRWIKICALLILLAKSVFYQIPFFNGDLKSILSQQECDSLLIVYPFHSHDSDSVLLCYCFMVIQMSHLIVNVSVIIITKHMLMI